MSCVGGTAVDRIETPVVGTVDPGVGVEVEAGGGVGTGGGVGATVDRVETLKGGKHEEGVEVGC